MLVARDASCPVGSNRHIPGRISRSAGSLPRAIAWLAAASLGAVGCDSSVHLGSVGVGSSSSAGSTSSTGGASGTSGSAGGAGGMSGAASASSSSAGGMGGATSSSSAGGAGGAASSSSGSLCIPGAVEPCYEGPPSTLGVGLCVGGTRTCDAQGMTFGPCTGQVLPSPESCMTPEDDDCNGSTMCLPASSWEKVTSSSTGDGWSLNVAVDGEGSSIITGRLMGTIDFGGGPLPSGDDVFVAKFDTNGNHVFSKHFGELPQEEMGLSVAVDPAGNILVAGYTDGPIDFGGGPLPSTGSRAAFLVKLDGSGALLWAKRFGDVSGKPYGNAISTGVAVDVAGNVVLYGQFQGALDLGGGQIPATGGGFERDTFLVKFDPAGNHLWSKRAGSTIDDTAFTVAVGPSGEIVISGLMGDTVDFGNGVVLQTPGPGRAFVAKLDPNGNAQWAKNGQRGRGYDLVVDAVGNVFVAGMCSADLDYGGGPVWTLVPMAFVVKLNPSGDHLWTRHFGGPGTLVAHGAAVDAAGSVFFTGEAEGTNDFGNGPFVATKQDVFVAKLDLAGNLAWSKVFGAADTQVATAVAVDSAGIPFITGYFTGTVDFGYGPHTSPSYRNVFLVKLPP